MNMPHKHAELIKAWADGAEIQRRVTYKNGIKGEWVDIARGSTPLWGCDDHEFRIKPPREFPKTSLSNETLWEEYYKTLGYGPHLAKEYANSSGSSHHHPALKHIANVAIKQYILDQEAGK